MQPLWGMWRIVKSRRLSLRSQSSMAQFDWLIICFYSPGVYLYCNGLISQDLEVYSFQIAMGDSTRCKIRANKLHDRLEACQNQRKPQSRADFRWNQKLVEPIMSSLPKWALCITAILKSTPLDGFDTWEVLSLVCHWFLQYIFKGTRGVASSYASACARGQIDLVCGSRGLLETSRYSCTSVWEASSQGF